MSTFRQENPGKKVSFVGVKLPESLLQQKKNIMLHESKTKTNTKQLKEWGFQDQHHQNRTLLRTDPQKCRPRAAEVMILREDSYWFQDFQLKKLLRIGEGAPKNDGNHREWCCPSLGMDGQRSCEKPRCWSLLKGNIPNKYPLYKVY